MNNTLIRLLLLILLTQILFSCKKEESSIRVLNADTRLVLLDYPDEQQTFTLTNIGNEALNWSARASSEILTLSPENGVIAPGDSTMVIVLPDRQNLEEGTYDFDITVDNEIRDIRIVVELRHFIEHKTLLEGKVVDAAYNRFTDELWMVTDRELIKYSFPNQSMESSKINVSANAMSLAPNGEKLIIGGNEKVEIYATETMEHLHSIAIPEDAFDIELTNENWAYFINGNGNSSDSELYNINLENETVIYDPTMHRIRISRGSKIKLHPSSNYLYVADYLLISPPDIKKFSINADQRTTPLYDSPYHGDFPIRGGMWFSEEGERLFSQAGSIFNSTEDPETDLTFIDSFEDRNWVMAFDHSLAANRICLVRSTEVSSRGGAPGNELEFYEPTSLENLSSITFPNSLVSNLEGELTIRPSEGHFIFINSTGDRFISVLKSRVESENEASSWALYSGEMN